MMERVGSQTGHKLTEKRLQNSVPSHLCAWGLHSCSLTSQGGKVGEKASWNRAPQSMGTVGRGKGCHHLLAKSPRSPLVLAFLPPPWAPSWVSTTPDITLPQPAQKTEPLEALAPPTQWHLSPGTQHL